MLVFLETLYNSNIGEELSKILRILIIHTNTLLFGLNDLLDHKMIETNSFTPKRQVFAPKEILKFMIDLAEWTSFEENGFIDFKVRAIDGFETLLDFRNKFE